MPVEHDDIKITLKRLGCKNVHEVKKVIEYRVPKSKVSFYVLKDNKYPQVVIQPAFEVFRVELSNIEGVNAKTPYYHNADMSRFPKRFHRGKTAIHYGLAFEFDSNVAVEQFMANIIALVQD